MKNIYKGFLMTAVMGVAISASAQSVFTQLKEAAQKPQQSSSVAPGRTVKFLKDTELELTWNGTAWDTVGKNLYTYNTQLLEDVITNQSYNQGTFSNSERQSYEYNAAGDLTLYLEEYWTGTAWEGSFKQVQTYDAQGYRLYDVYLNWEPATSTWDTAYAERNIFTYNTSNHVTKQVTRNWDAGVWTDSYTIDYTVASTGAPSEGLVKVWDPGTSTWTQYKIKFTWDTFKANKPFYLLESLFTTEVTNHKPLTVIAQMEAPIVGWVDALRITRAYNADGKVTSYIYEEMDPSTFAWTKTRTSYTYTGMLLTQEVVEVDDAGTWVNDTRASYTYDNKNNQTEVTNEVYSGGVWVMDSGQRDFYTYDSNNAITVDEIHIYNPTTSTWDKQTKFIYTNQAFTGLHNVAGASIKIYPNPALDVVTIELGLNKGSFVTVLDISGRVILADSIAEKASNTTVDLSSFKSGVYFINVLTTEGMLKAKVIKN